MTPTATAASITIPPMPLSVVILAAGQGKRMKSDLPKVLQPLAGRPLLKHVIDVAHSLKPAEVYVVYGHGGERVRETLKDEKVTWVLQAEQLGTGHAVLQAAAGHSRRTGSCWCCTATCRSSAAQRIESLVELAGPDAVGLLTMISEDPTGYGRVVRNARGEVQKIVEQKDATEGRAQDHGVQYRHHRGAGETPAQVARPAEEQQRAGRVLPHRRHRHGGEGKSEGQSARRSRTPRKCSA